MKKDDFQAGRNKCNKFVYDVTKAAGAEALTAGSDGKLRPPMASEWADPNVKITGWMPLSKGQQPAPGDVAAYPLSGGGSAYSGHSGIVTSVGPEGVGAMAAHPNVVGPDDKFQPGPGVTYRRYTGDE